MSPRLPLHEIERGLLVALGGGPRLVGELAAMVGQPPALVEVALRGMYIRGLVWSRLEGIWRRAPARRPRSFEIEAGSSTWGFAAEDAQELTPAQVGLQALEPKMADARRILGCAACTRTPFRDPVCRLASEAKQLHHEVLQAIEAARPKGTP